ncbi:MAG: 2-C-methyl-D-erythritol 4-phosphate cytidylyltransferase [Deltaproteobacteria bacterium]|nr:2-C-methyl-D-erythritol 4-phosphate cytidylyltransferase [Deltaproteobacteria bacterium]
MISSTEGKCIAIVPAAGAGTRMGGPTKKQFLRLAGKPILTHTLERLESCPEIDGVILVVPSEEVLFCREEIVQPFGLQKILSVLVGGRERQDSVRTGLQALPESTTVVVIHDGVRPFAEVPLFRQCIETARKGVGAVVGLPVVETIKSVGPKRRVLQTVPRERLWSIQTPQAFPASLLHEAYDRAGREGFYGTDDASLVERIGYPVEVLRGSESNIKITSPGDLLMGEVILKERTDHAHRTGI